VTTPISEFAAIVQERAEAFMAHDNVVHLRVTSDAIPGSIVAIPLTDERERLLGVPPGGHYREMLIHPDDWRRIRAHPAVRELAPEQRISRLYGIRVTEEP
jgi:hypothetical protein